jgi:hypothetical protein
MIALITPMTNAPNAFPRRLTNSLFRSRRQLRCWAIVAALQAVAFQAAVFGQVSDGTVEKRAEETPKAKASIERMRRFAQTLTVSVAQGDGQELATIQERPILHYSDAGGITTDATIWAWGRAGRPVALAGIFFERMAPRNDKWNCELTALADESVTVEGRPGWKWGPAKSGVDVQPMPGAPTPADTAKRRARQMGELARSFSVSETFSAERTDQLRLMVHPLYRYGDCQPPLIDGALYAFANGTNPEALLLLECRETAGGQAEWCYGFARLGAAQLQARLNDATVWERPGIENWSSTDPYFSVFGDEAAVFGSAKVNGFDTRRSGPPPS